MRYQDLATPQPGVPTARVLSARCAVTAPEEVPQAGGQTIALRVDRDLGSGHTWVMTETVFIPDQTQLDGTHPTQRYEFEPLPAQTTGTDTVPGRPADPFASFYDAGSSSDFRASVGILDAAPIMPQLDVQLSVLAKQYPNYT